MPAITAVCCLRSGFQPVQFDGVVGDQTKPLLISLDPIESFVDVSDFR
jgi:hypothetical protein